MHNFEIDLEMSNYRKEEIESIGEYYLNHLTHTRITICLHNLKVMLQKQYVQ